VCGISGKVSFGGAPVSRELVARMNASLVHRGPDDSGVFTEGPVGLGERRLAIIDLQHSATAPLPNEDRTVWVVFNGEIYNFREIRDDLRRRGHQFSTGTDTEVLVHLYEESGTEMVHRLVGMFAFAIWDTRRRRLFAARDRLGKKPLVYARTPQSLVFGSEIKAVTSDPDIPTSPDYQAIDAYLTYQYVPSPLTAFAGISKVPPGHYFTCDADGTFSMHRYWAPPVPSPSMRPRSELEEELRARLRTAVRRRLVSDVPLGAFLSGGIDSATVVALMAEATDGPVRTFSIGFEDAEYNELPYARLVAERFSTRHEELVVRPNAAEVLPLLVRHFNEPFADPSALPTFYLAQMTRRHVTVALSGDGGDESFAGYENYAAVQRWSRGDALPGVVRRTVSRAGGVVLGRLPQRRSVQRGSRGLAMLAGTVPERFRLQASFFKPEEKRIAYTPAFREAIGAIRAAELTPLPWHPGMEPVGWMMRYDQSYYLPDCLNVKVDIAAMANSLEVRCPLQDHELVEFAATIPAGMKRDASGGKVIFKSAMRDLLPAAILTKPKTGFGIPLARWFRGDLQPLLRETLLDARSRSRGLFEPAVVRRMVDEHASGARDWSSRLWALLMLELWFREFIDQRARAA
jgi:asparagine synthase (glutamine-hydrolysing)